jgi:spore coat protein U-like protein
MRQPRLLLLLATSFGSVLATPAVAATTSATTTVNVVRPVSIAKLQDMDFGTLTFAGFTGTRSIAVSRAGVLTCATDIVCSGAARQARFNIQGTNKMVVLLTYSGGTLSNGVDSIPFTANGQASITMINSGAPGIDLEVGGVLTISPTLVGGVYSGTMTVTADYQ